MADLRETSYDKISLAHSSLPEIEANLDKINTYEPVIATDTKAMYYKDENGNIINISQEALDVANNANNNVNTKLDKGAYDGTAEDLNDSIEQNKSDILLINDTAYKLKTKTMTGSIDYDNLKESGLFTANGSGQGSTNAPYIDPSLVRVWRTGDWTMQETVSYYNPENVFTRCFKDGQTNVPWEKKFNTKNCPISKAENGWCKLANGLIIQWGKLIFEELKQGTQQEKTLSLPMSFSNNYYKVITEVSDPFTPININSNHNSKTTANLKMRCMHDANLTKTVDVEWIAIGY